MKIKQALILCAGFGTRMGKIGEVLPKPLWPIGSKKLLELQVEALFSVGVEKIYINTHHQSEMISDFVRLRKLPVEVIFEKDILDVGGAVQNLVNIGKSGWTIIINSDQLIQDFTGLFRQLGELVSDEVVAALAVNELDENEHYNRLRVKKNELQRIVPFGMHSEEDIFTYSGVSFLNLDEFNKDMKIAHKNFFDFLFINQKKKAIKISPISRNRFYDVGKMEKYISYIYDSEKLDACFGTDVSQFKVGEVYNFSLKDWGTDVPDGSIILDGEKVGIDQRSLIFRGLVDQF